MLVPYPDLSKERESSQEGGIVRFRYQNCIMFLILNFSWPANIGIIQGVPAVGKQGIIVGFYGGIQCTPLIPKARPIGAERDTSVQATFFPYLICYNFSSWSPCCQPYCPLDDIFHAAVRWESSLAAQRSHNRSSLFRQLLLSTLYVELCVSICLRQIRRL